MKNLVFVGPADIRELSAEDYDKIGVKVKKNESLKRGESFSVSEVVAKKLLESPLLKGEFEEYDEEKHGMLALEPATRFSEGPDGSGGEGGVGADATGQASGTDTSSSGATT